MLRQLQRRNTEILSPKSAQNDDSWWVGLGWSAGREPYTSTVPLLHLFEFDAFLVGLLFGSLLNVCIARLPLHESIVTPRSHCPACGHTIRWYDNIPLLSWVVLRARCRDCKARISWQYPAVELLTGIWFARVGGDLYYLWNIYAISGGDMHYSTSESISLSIPLIGFAILGFLLIGLMVMDWQTHRLPDAFTLTGTAIGLFLVCVQAIFLEPGQDQVLLANQHIQLRSPGSGSYEGNVFLTGPEVLIFGRIAAVVGAALLLLIVRWVYKAIRKRDGMGLGDVKMLAMIAAFLGFTQSLVALFAGAFAASFYGVFLIVTGKARAATKLPFGSFLAVGGLLAALFGQRIVDWYTNLLH
jgi:leader peptidase (prepilin peptidase) / N-methyltransferase